MLAFKVKESTGGIFFWNETDIFTPASLCLMTFIVLIVATY